MGIAWQEHGEAAAGMARPGPASARQVEDVAWHGPGLAKHGERMVGRARGRARTRKAMGCGEEMKKDQYQKKLRALMRSAEALRLEAENQFGYASWFLACDELHLMIGPTHQEELSSLVGRYPVNPTATRENSLVHENFRYSSGGDW